MTNSDRLRKELHKLTDKFGCSVLDADMLKSHNADMAIIDFVFKYFVPRADIEEQPCEIIPKLKEE